MGKEDEIKKAVEKAVEKTRQELKKETDKAAKTIKESHKKDEENYKAIKKQTKQLSVSFAKVPRRRDSVKHMLNLIFVSIVIILVVALGSNLYIFFNKTSSDAAYLSNLLTTGIAVISIAIAVWAGLHIIQAIEHNRLSDFDEKYVQYEDERKRIYKEQFLSDLNLQDRSETQYLYECFSKAISYKDDIPSSIYYRLYCMEMNHKNIYSKRIEIIKEYEDYKIDTLAYSVNELLSELNSSSICELSRKTIYEYLKCRLAGYYFNLSYDESLLYQSGMEFLKNVIDIYTKLYSIFITIDGTSVSIDTKAFWGTLNKIYDEKLKQRYYIHVLNIIGEAYSSKALKAIRFSETDNLTEKKRKDLLDAADKDLAFANAVYKHLTGPENDNIKKEHLGEFIYRNYGAALERALRIKDREIEPKDYIKNAIDKKNFHDISEIQKQYKESMVTALYKNPSGDFTRNAFFVWSSLFRKVVDVYPYLSAEDKATFEKELSFKAWVEASCVYLKIAVQKHPGFLGFYHSYSLAMLLKAHFDSFDPDKKELVKEELRSAIIIKEASALLLNDRLIEDDESIKKYDELFSVISKTVNI